MAHQIHIPRRAPAGFQNTKALHVLTLLLAFVGLLVLADINEGATPPEEVVRPALEDWHGNVRRSHGPY